MALGTVLDPCVHPQSSADTTNEAVGSIAGKRIGIRRDTAWRSWDWVTDEWEQSLRDLGADVRYWRAAESVVGKEATARASGLDAFVEGIDVAVFGLCNCGSCTMQTVTDALVAVRQGIPTVVVTTENFRPIAESIARLEGHPELRLVEMPFPLEGRVEPEVRSIARERIASLFATLGVDA